MSLFPKARGFYSRREHSYIGRREAGEVIRLPLFFASLFRLQAGRLAPAIPKTPKLAIFTGEKW